MTKSRFFYAGLCFTVASLLQVWLVGTKNEPSAFIVAGFYFAAAAAMFFRAYRDKIRLKAAGRTRPFDCRVR